MLRNLLIASLLLALPFPAAAQNLLQEREDKRGELEQVEAGLAEIAQRREALKAEIAALEDDRAAINRALIETAKRGQELESSVAETEARLATLNTRRDTIRASLKRQRGLLLEIIAALQRMGRSPPPALLVRPDDALAAIRSAIMLGAVVPRLRGRTRTLVVELDALRVTSREIERQKAALAESLNALAEDEARLTLLLQRKRDNAEKSRQRLLSDQQQAEKLAGQANSLSALIGGLEKQIASATAAAEAAKRADEAQRQAAEARLAAARAALEKARKSGAQLAALTSRFGDAGRIEPAIPFTEAKGMLPRPASGVSLYAFGEKTGSGPARNIAIATRANARIRAPADGWVVYAGPFRSYGRVLILNAGGGYHLVLSGLRHTDVSPGQFVLAGEPVGRMGTSRVAAASGLALGSSRPVLYVEFRKDGSPVDPAPWWATGKEGPNNDS